ncbi:MAG: hypothetical protein ABFC94_15085 [Syntrophomonas sp.]
MDARDEKQIIKLAREGKQISKICDDFPQYDYWDVYCAVYGAGEKSALGTKRMITNRLNWLLKSSPQQQTDLIEEINDLVWHLYTRYQESQKKLDEIRHIINR